jgi:predicted enzyme related to lactoylglutathione lyase
VSASLAMLVNIDVEDLDTAIHFYESAIGLNLRRRLFDGTVAEMSGVSSPVYLVQKARDSSPSPGTDQVRDYRRHWTPVHVDFVVPELQAAVDRALRAGAKIEGGVQVFSWGRMATISDPFGNGLCLVQWSNSGYDEMS